MPYNARSEDLNDKPITRKWLAEHPEAAALFEHVLRKLRPHFTGDNQGYIDKQQYRFNDQSTGGYVIVVAQVNRVVVILEPQLPSKKRFEVLPATFEVNVRNLLTELAACKPNNFDWSQGITIETEPENEEAGPPDVVQLKAIKIRRGQGKFRESLLEAYGRTCAISGCKIVELLEAAHIQPHAKRPNYSVTNGLLLRADLHTLFDLGMLAVDAQLRVEVAPALLSSEYKNLEGKKLRHPLLPSEMPNKVALERRYSDFHTTHYF